MIFIQETKSRCPAECHGRNMFGRILFQILRQRLDVLNDTFCAFCLSISYEFTSNQPKTESINIPFVSFANYSVIRSFVGLIISTSSYKTSMNKSTYCYGNLICRLFLWKVMLLHCDISACFPETTTRRGNHISRLRYRFLEVPFSEFLGNPTEKGTFERRCCKSAQFRGPPAHLFIQYRGLFHRHYNGRGVEFPSIAEAKNVQSATSSLPFLCLHGLHRDKFTFTLLTETTVSLLWSFW